MRKPVQPVEAVCVVPTTDDEITDDDARRAGAASRDELLDRLGDRPDRPVFRVALR